MAEVTPAPSQENIAIAGSPPTAPNIRKSPFLPTFGSANNDKPRKPPTITPRSFTRFFTPKSSLERGSRVGASRQALRDITASAANRRGRKSPRKDVVKLSDHQGISPTHGIKRKRTKAYSPIPTPDLSSPLKRIRNQSLELSEDDRSDAERFESSSEAEQFLTPVTTGFARRKHATNPISRSRCTKGLGRNLQRELYGQSRKLERLVGVNSHSCPGDWQHETANFSTKPEDRYVSFNLAAPSDHTIPFCTVGCNCKSDPRRDFGWLMRPFSKFSCSCW